MDLVERWTRYMLKMQCKVCGDEIYAHEEDARADVEHILKTHDFRNPSIDDLRDALSWLSHGGEFCDYHAAQLDKDD